MKPIKKTILAEVLPEEKTKSGLIILDFRMKKYKAKVLAVGPDVKYLEVGDTIHYDHNLVQNYNYQGKECIWITEDKGFKAKI